MFQDQESILGAKLGFDVKSLRAAEALSSRDMAKPGKKGFGDMF